MWDQIRSNRRRSVFVVTAMGVLLVAVGMALGATFAGTRQGILWGGGIAFGLWLVQWIVMRSSGDDILLQMAGAKEIQKADHPQLFNVVEEMTIAANLGQMPRVFIVDDPSPNAFAVGRDPDRAAVAVTIGLLKRMNRDELQGVIGHEIGHVKNRDVALMTTAGIMAGAIVLLAEVGLRALWWTGGSRRSRDSGGGGAQAVMMIVSVLLLILAPILAQLIYLALSRRREYLADASSAMFTRYPEGLASALEKLGGASVPQADQSRVTAPMYIVRPLKQGEHRSLSEAFATHPPLEKRIRILRSMGGRADPRAYDEAWRRVQGKKDHVVGTGSLADAAETEARPAASGDAPSEPARLREASDAYLAGAGYQKVHCATCGATLKIPPELQGRVQSCLRCGAPL